MSDMETFSVVYGVFVILFVSPREAFLHKEDKNQACITISSCPVISTAVIELFCTNGFNVGTNCTFTCPPYYVRVGESSIQCQERSSCGVGVWSSSIPYCRALYCSEPLPKVDNAIYVCSRKSKLGSVCKYKCNAGYRLVPPDHTGFLCYKNARWVGDPKPCCYEDVGPCPPNLKADVVYLVDSSSSVRYDNFELILSFITETIMYFKVGPNKARFAFIRFNRAVYNEFNFNSNLNDRESYAEAIRKINYDGSGTKTGAALRYVDSVVFKESNGDRPDVPNVIFLFTDGRPNDSIASPSRILLRKGVLFVVLAIGSPKYIPELAGLYGDPEQRNILYFETYDHLLEYGPSKVAELLCPYRCA